MDELPAAACRDEGAQGAPGDINPVIKCKENNLGKNCANFTKVSIRNLQRKHVENYDENNETKNSESNDAKIENSNDSACDKKILS